MTIAVAATVPSAKTIVTVCDARLSYGEAIPAADDATMKNRRVAHKWGMMFAAEDSTAFVPVVVETKRILEQLSGQDDIIKSETDFGTQQVMEAAKKAYEKEFHERFFRDHLSRFGFADIAEFRRAGLLEMGKDLYHEYAMKLARADLGLELLVYGFNSDGLSRENLYRALGGDAKPEFDTVMKVLHALGISLVAQPQSRVA